MSMVMEILQDLWDMELNYKGVKVNFFGVPRFLLPDKDNNKSTYRSTLSRLSKKGYAKSDGSGKWVLTDKGKEYFRYKTKKIFRQFGSPFKTGSVKNLLIMFDIPETMKKERHWFREHLRKFNYEMIQKSVWVGPSPLPKDFISYAKELGLEKCIKQFKLAGSPKLNN